MSVGIGKDFADLPPDIIREKNMLVNAAKQRIPLSGIFELTPRCSLRCKMCYVRLDEKQMDTIGRELTAREWIALAEEAADNGTLYLLLTGGEPLLREDFEEIYTALCHMGFLISLNTNATLVTPEMVALLRRYPPQMTTVTLYGASPDTYGRVCGDPTGFDKTMRGLELLSAVPAELVIRATVIQDNWHELDAMRVLAEGFERRLSVNARIYKAVRGATAEAEKYRLTRRQMTEFEKAHRDCDENPPDSPVFMQEIARNEISD
ncbi:MAG: radical SAM protein, partial [Clostridiales bacterium]|nr:radical SAM protein [Clostridiales bacterium]